MHGITCENAPESDEPHSFAILLSRSGVAVAVAGSGGGVASFADGCHAGVHALLAQEAPLSGQNGAGRQGPALAERETL